MRLDLEAVHAMMPHAPLVEILTTYPTEEAAAALASRLVRERLAACVQIDGPVRSTYAWKGSIEMATEWRCTCKTTSARAAACADTIAACHPYETPEIITKPMTASPAYATWVSESVAEDGGRGGANGE